MAKQKIITFSGQARHGKDSSVQILKQLLESNGKRVLSINYADHLKYLAKQYMNWDGNKDEKGRTILQQLGTEKVRTRFPNYWVDITIGIAKVFENDYDYVLIGDCRFPNEIKTWKDEGYNIIPIHVEHLEFDNGLTKEQKNHPSETALNDYQFTEYIKADCLDSLEKQIKLKILPLILEESNCEKQTFLVDMDDVLNNLVESWVAYLNKKYNTNVSVNDISSWDISKAFPTLSKEEVYAPLYIDEFWEIVKPEKDNIEGLNQMINDGHKVIIVTASAYQTIHKKFELFFSYCTCLSWDDVIVTSQKQMIKGDALFDDGVHNLEGGEYKKLLIDRPHNRYYNAEENGIRRVSSIKEGYELLKSIT